MHRTLITAIVATLLLSAPTLASNDWPLWSGPSGDRAASEAAFDSGGALELAWTAAIGTGYSGISVVGDTAVTAFSDENKDWLAGFDVKSGERRWRYELGSAYEGHDGSEDGPAFTPAIADGTVYGLAPKGKLFAVRLADGKEVWAKDLSGSAESPDYGFASSPAVAGDVLVVETGAESGTVAAFDRKTGKQLWTAGDDSIGYQSPVFVELSGVEQIVAVGNTKVFGLRPADGDVLWQATYKENDEEGIAHPVPVGDDGILLQDYADAVLMKVVRDGDSWSAEEAWRSNRLNNTYAIPVYWKGHVYGYAGRFLTCLDAVSGEVVWKSRPPGSGSLIRVGDALVIYTEEGEVVVAEATPDGYNEMTRIEALDGGHLTAPSFAGDHIYVRNSSTLARLDVTDRPMAAPSVEPLRPTVTEAAAGRFADFVASLQDADTDGKKSRIDAFLERQLSFPVVEGDDLVHFVYRGDAEDVALFGTMVQGGSDLPLAKVEGTDFWFLSRQVEPGGYYTYGFNLFDQFVPDPRNDEPLDAGQSILTMPGFEAPAHLAEPTGAKGELVEYTWKSDSLENERKIDIYLPAGYESSGKRYPLLVVNHGNQALGLAQMDRTLDNLISSAELQPLVAAFVPRAAYSEYAGSGPDDYARALSEELVPYLRQTYRLDNEPAAIMGVGSAGFSALFVAMQEPETFSRASVQSFYDGEKIDELEAMIADSDGAAGRFFVQWSRHDYDDPTGIDAQAQSRDIAERLAAAGHQVQTLEVGDSPAWGAWRLRNDRILAFLFPAE